MKIGEWVRIGISDYAMVVPGGMVLRHDGEKFSVPERPSTSVFVPNSRWFTWKVAAKDDEDAVKWWIEKAAANYENTKSEQPPTLRYRTPRGHSRPAKR